MILTTLLNSCFKFATGYGCADAVLFFFCLLNTWFLKLDNGVCFYSQTNGDTISLEPDHSDRCVQVLTSSFNSWENIRSLEHDINMSRRRARQAKHFASPSAAYYMCLKFTHRGTKASLPSVLASDGSRHAPQESSRPTPGRATLSCNRRVHDRLAARTKELDLFIHWQCRGKK